MGAPQIVTDLSGIHSKDFDRTVQRLSTSRAYQDLSTICITPAISGIPPKVVLSWRNLMAPMNQKFLHIILENMEVGDAYNAGVEFILNHPELSKWKYILTLETDNMPQPDGLLKLCESIKEFDVVGGLYFTKGDGGMPMIYGNPKEIPLSFRPQQPMPNMIQPACGLGMGFTLFRTSIFKDKNLRKPWFQSKQSHTPGVGSACYTQDLYFFEDAFKLGYKMACDTRVTVGHYDYANDRIY